MTAVSAATRAKALLGVGVFARRAGDYDQARRALETSLALARGRQPEWVAGLALSHLGHIARREGDLVRATSQSRRPWRCCRWQASLWLVFPQRPRLHRHGARRRGACGGVLRSGLTLARRVGATSG